MRAAWTRWVAAFSLGAGLAGCGARPVIFTIDASGGEDASADATGSDGAGDGAGGLDGQDASAGDTATSGLDDASSGDALGDALGGDGDLGADAHDTAGGEPASARVLIGHPALSAPRARVVLDWWASPSSRLRWRLD